jgi:hypothetical protein
MSAVHQDEQMRMELIGQHVTRDVGWLMQDKNNDK